MTGWRIPVGFATALAVAAGSLLPPGPGRLPAALLGGGGLLLAILAPRLRAPAGRAVSTAAVILLGLGAGGLRAPGPPPPAAPHRNEARVAGRVRAWEAGERGPRLLLEAVRLDGARLDPPLRLRVYAPRGWGRVPRSGWLRLRGRLEPERGATNPGAWAPRGLDGTLFVARGTDPDWGPGRPSFLLRTREGLEARLERILAGFPRRLATAMLLGRSGALLPGEREVFRRTGASHLTAVSGLHVGLFAGLLALVLAGAPAPFRAGAVSAAAWGVAALAGGSPSALRAASLVTLAAGGLAFHRPRPAILWLGPALAGLLTASPALLASVSFRLSVGAVGGILFALELVRPPAGGKGALLSLATAGLGAQWGTLPTALSTFGTLSPAALLPNLAAVPLAGLFLPAVLFAVLTADVPGVGVLFAEAARGLGGILGAALGLGARTLPYLSGWPPPHPAVPAAAGLLLLVWFSAPPDRRRRPRVRALGAILAGTAAAGLLVPRPAPPGPWALFLDVGQGDAAVLRLSDGTAWVVDTGDDRGPGDGARNAVLPALRHLGLRRVDGLILSHRHRDHVGGLESLLEGTVVTHVYDAGYGSTTGTSGRVDAALAAHRLVPCLVAAGDTLHAGPGGARLVAVGPPRGDPAGPPPGGNLNEASLMVRVTDGPLTVLLAGDGERRAEAAAVASGLDLRAAVLKVGHHGSRTSSHPRFLAAVKARDGVVSCGVGNRYGHPDPEALRRLREAGVRLLRTDRGGAVLLRPGPGGGLRRRRWPPRPTLSATDAPIDP